MTDEAAMTEIMAELRRKYVVLLKERRQVIADFLSGCESHPINESLCESARKQAHSFAGSGAIYGFADITDTGRALEHALQDGLRDAKILGGIAQALLDACDRAVDTETPPSPAPDKPAPAAESKKPLLLIADDDVAMRDVLTSLFSQDADIIVAANGREALEMAKSCKPDLILLDDVMPEVSGMKVLETLHASPETAHIPVVMLTASDREKDVMRGLMGGAADYITKPFKPEQLAEKIRSRLSRGRYTILIADDDAAIRNLLEYKFRALGCHVILARDGEQALKEAKAHKPHLLILDRMMPGLDGIAVLQKLHQADGTKAIPILFLTARRREQDILEGFNLGAADYIVKPFKPEEVLARSLRLLRGEKP